MKRSTILVILSIVLLFVLACSFTTTSTSPSDTSVAGKLSRIGFVRDERMDTVCDTPCRGFGSGNGVVVLAYDDETISIVVFVSSEFNADRSAKTLAITLVSLFPENVNDWIIDHMRGSYIEPQIGEVDGYLISITQTSIAEADAITITVSPPLNTTTSSSG